MRAEERIWLIVFEMNCFRGKSGVTLRDWFNSDLLIRKGIVRMLENRVDLCIPRGFEHMVRMDEKR